jgi:hypothetical protein
VIPLDILLQPVEAELRGAAGRADEQPGILERAANEIASARMG